MKCCLNRSKMRVGCLHLMDTPSCGLFFYPMKFVVKIVEEIVHEMAFFACLQAVGTFPAIYFPGESSYFWNSFPLSSSGSHFTILISFLLSLLPFVSAVLSACPSPFPFVVFLSLPPHTLSFSLTHSLPINYLSLSLSLSLSLFPLHLLSFLPCIVSLSLSP